MTYTQFENPTEDHRQSTAQPPQTTSASNQPDMSQYHSHADSQAHPVADNHPQSDSQPVKDLYSDQTTTTYTYDDDQPQHSGPAQPPPSDNSANADEPPYQTGAPGAIGDPRAQMAQTMRSNTATTRLLRSIEILWNVLELATIVTILPIYWHQECDKNGLRTFLIARCCVNFLLILLHMWYFSRKREGLNKFLRFCASLTEYCFVLYALVQLGNQETCSATNPSTFGLSIALCVVTMLIICAPVLLLILVCCCLPCILRAVVRYIELAGAPEAATQEEINKMPEYPWTPTFFAENSIKGSQTECAICMVEYEQGDILRLYPCHHAFHKACGDQWAVMNKACAVCRCDVITGSSPQAADTAQPVRNEIEMA